MHTTTTARRHGRGALGLALLTTALLALTACTQEWDDGPWTRSLPTADQISELRAVVDCDELVESSRPLLAASVDSMWPESAGSDDVAVAASAGDAEQFSPSAGAAVPSTVAPAPAARSLDATQEDGALDEGAGDSSESDDSTGSPETDVVGTNNQERGVEEVDLIKTDGRRIVSIVDGTLRVVVLDEAPEIDGTLPLAVRQATDLFLRGDTALVLGTTHGDTRFGDTGVENTGFGGDGSGVGVQIDGAQVSEEGDTTTSTTVSSTTTPPDTTTTSSSTSSTTTSTSTTSTTSTAVPTTTTAVLPGPPPFAVATTLTLVSLEDPAAPTVVANADVEGSLVTARETDGVARIVLRGTPVAVDELLTSTSRDEATAALDAVDPDTLLPRVSTGAEVTPLGSCDDVLVAAPVTTVPAGGTTDGGADTMGSFQPTPMIETITVLSVGDDLAELSPVSVQGTAETVYASTDSLYVAAGAWDREGSRTDVHRFDLAGEGPAVYTGSGRAPGHLLNQFALSERDGALRMVTTLDGSGVGGGDVPMPMPMPMPVEPDGGTGGVTDGSAGSAAIGVVPAGASSARLTVLDTQGTLDEIGHLDGMGIGEQVQSVRFMDDLAYVVTFRQVDPLYALDLSDPRAPRVLGELKIPGFSEYLHPVGEGLLLGVGRQVDPDSGLDEGLKISLFDVSDPLAMSEVDQLVLANAWSNVAQDHKAFTWDPQRHRAVIPLDRQCGPAEACTTAGGGYALVLDVADDELAEVAQLAHGGAFGMDAIMRSVIVGDDLWTLSPQGLGRTDADAPGAVDLLVF